MDFKRKVAPIMVRGKLDDAKRASRINMVNDKEEDEMANASGSSSIVFSMTDGEVKDAAGQIQLQ